jgi:hypothetical protein
MKKNIRNLELDAILNKLNALYKYQINNKDKKFNRLWRGELEKVNWLGKRLTLQEMNWLGKVNWLRKFNWLEGELLNRLIG